MNFLKISGYENFTMEQAEESAKCFHKAMKGFGTDEKRIIKEIVSHSNGQRQLIKEKYLTMYGKKLKDDLKSELKGEFQDAVLALLEASDEFEAKSLKNAISGIGTDEKSLILILCPKEPKEIEKLKATFKRKFDKDIENELRHEEEGGLGRIIRSVASGSRDDSNNVDLNLAKEEAKGLYDAGEGKLGTDESKFIEILCSRNFEQLNATFAEYSRYANHEIEKAIKNEMSGDLERACLAIVKSAKNKVIYYAEQLHEAMKGIGTNDGDFIYILVSRSEIDLPGIKEHYKMLFGKSLVDAVKNDLRGDYEDLIVALLKKS